MKKFITPLKITALLSLLMTGSSAFASTAYYKASVDNRDATGNSSVSNSTGAFIDADLFLETNGNHLSSYASANSQASSINLFGRTTSNRGITIAPGGVARGVIGFDDIIFTDTTNPGRSGTINVSVNILSYLSTIVTAVHGPEVSTGTKFDGKVGLTTASISLATGNLFSGSMNGSNFTTGSITVNLNTFYTLSFSSSLEYLSAGGTDAIFSSAMRLDATPFNLAAGYTVNSVQAEIVNNAVSPVPVPASFWLLGSGLLGLIGVARRKSRGCTR